jgi:phosphatidate cytidylyltransferase
MGAGFLVAANFVPPLGCWALLVAVSALAQHEFYKIVNRPGIPVFRVLGIVCGTALISATFFTLVPSARQAGQACRWEQFVILASLIAVFLRQFPQKNNDTPLATIGCTLLGIWYIPFLFNYFTKLAFSWEEHHMGGSVGRTGRMLVLYLVVVVKSTDMGAYFAGMHLGRHKLFPRISPAKTWEGLAGGLMTGIAVSVLFSVATRNLWTALVISPWDAAALGCILSVSGSLGDMFESLIKRAGGTKDSGNSVPGMGGILDVLDSLLFGAPILYMYAWLFLR